MYVHLDSLANHSWSSRRRCAQAVALQDSNARRQPSSHKHVAWERTVPKAALRKGHARLGRTAIRLSVQVFLHVQRAHWATSVRSVARHRFHAQLVALAVPHNCPTRNAAGRAALVGGVLQGAQIAQLLPAKPGRSIQPTVPLASQHVSTARLAHAAVCQALCSAIRARRAPIVPIQARLSATLARRAASVHNQEQRV